MTDMDKATRCPSEHVLNGKRIVLSPLGIAKLQQLVSWARRYHIEAAVDAASVIPEEMPELKSQTVSAAVREASKMDLHSPALLALIMLPKGLAQMVWLSQLKVHEGYAQPAYPTIESLIEDVTLEQLVDLSGEVQSMSGVSTGEEEPAPAPNGTAATRAKKKPRQKA